MNKINEFENHLHNLNLKYATKIRGFDTNEIFVELTLTVGFINSFIHIVLGEEENNHLGNPTHIVGDLETVLGTNELSKQRGKGPNLNNPSNLTYCCFSMFALPLMLHERPSLPHTHTLNLLILTHN